MRLKNNSLKIKTNTTGLTQRLVLRLTTIFIHMLKLKSQDSFHRQIGGT